MLRGFLAGVFWGVVLIGGVLAAVSLLSPLPATVRPQTTAVIPQGPQQLPPEAPVVPALPQTPSQADARIEAQPAEAVSDEIAQDALPLAITEPAPKPAPDPMQDRLSAPEVLESGAVDIEGETSVFPNPQAQTPTAPDAEAELSISTNPAQPAAPSALSGEAFSTPVTPPVPDEISIENTLPEVPEGKGQSAPEKAENTEAQADQSASDVLNEAAQELETVEKDTTSDPLEDTLEDTDKAAKTPLVSEPVPSPVTEDLTPRAESEELSGEEEDLAAGLQPAGDLDAAFPQLKSERLPSVTTETETAASEVEVILDASTLRPVEANAEGFENYENKPMMSLVLIDTGTHQFDMEALESFPYPLSIAISTLDPQVTEKAADYRLRGFEVLAMVDMPAEASASDVEQAMQVHLSVSDSFVGVMEGLGEGLQGSKIVSDQVAQALRDSGHGLLMFSNGLNTAQKLAAKAGVPSTSVFRDFDNAGQTAVVMRRFLDNGAFKAAQENGVVMVGRLRDETISALLLWALQDRASTVAIAPISAAFDTIN